MLDRLRKHQKGVLAFLTEPEVPFTNNRAERDLRGVKVKQKVSGCFRTDGGAKAHLSLQALILTLRKQKLNLFEKLRDLFGGRPLFRLATKPM